VAQIECVVVQTATEMRQALLIRRAVFIEEQCVPEALEIDAHDGDPAGVTTAIHVLGLVDGRPVATGRLLLERDENGFAHVGRIAVLADERGRGYGRAVMQRLQALATERRYAGITLAAQLQAIGFYEKLGYVARGDIFLDAGIEHRWMDRMLNSSSGD
jgi:predicted GNAT family N-acyltransferase